MSDSTADRFIAVMARLKAIEPTLGDPMRHQARELREAGYKILDDAIRSAGQIASTALDISESCREAVEKHKHVTELVQGAGKP